MQDSVEVAMRLICGVAAIELALFIPLVLDLCRSGHNGEIYVRVAPPSDTR